MLTVKRHHSARELLIVIDDSLPVREGQVVARFNTRHNVLGLTPHGKGRAREIREVLARTSV